jgi:hypothetical protein
LKRTFASVSYLLKVLKEVFFLLSKWDNYISPCEVQKYLMCHVLRSKPPFDAHAELGQNFWHGEICVV